MLWRKNVVSQSDADAFVNDTLDYLTGIKTVWEPAITIGDHRVGVPDAFKTHMATVRGWVENAKAVLLAGAAIVLLLLGRALIGVKGSSKSAFSVGGYYLGAAIPLALGACVGLWGVLNFDGLWMWVHETLIPDGIFAADEEIMKLFPVELFASYLKPVGITFAICVAVVLALPLILVPLSKLLTAMFGKKRAAPAAQPPGEAPPARQALRKQHLRPRKRLPQRKQPEKLRIEATMSVTTEWYNRMESLAEQGFRSHPGFGIQL